MSNRVRPSGGMTLIELMVALLLLSVASVAALYYQYHAVKQAKRAEAEVTVTRTARLLIENWKNRGGDEFFEPTQLETGFTKIPSTDQYKATINDFPMTARLQWQDLEYDAVAGVTLRRIQVSIRWRSDFREGTIRTEDPEFIMTTYVRRDQAEG